VARQVKRRLWTWAGRLIAALALIYLGVAMRRQWRALSAWRPSVHDLAILVAASVVYGLAMLLIAEAWHRLVSCSAGTKLDRRITLPSSGVTQLAKYLPGNVMHYVGRHGWMARSGVPHGAIARAATGEIGCAVLAAATTAAGLAVIFPPASVPGLGAAEVRLLAIAAVALMACGGLVFGVARGRFPALARWTPSPLAAAAALLSLSGFYLTQAGVLDVVVFAAGARPLGQILPIAVGSWLIGYVTPGAPGGLGTREFALTLLLSPLLGPGPAVLVTVIFRLVTTGGDLWCFLLSSLIGRLPRPGDEANARLDAAARPR
jgi:hypothetical protein